MSKATLKSYLLQRTAFLGLRPAGATDAEDAVEPALAGSSGGLVVEGVAGGTPMPVSGTVTATVDTSALDMPRTHTAITPDDAEDITAVANWALLATGEGTLAYRTVGAPDVTVRIVIDGYTPIPGQFCRVMAETDEGVSVIGVSGGVPT